MANTSYLRKVVERYVRSQLQEEYGQPFASVVLPLTTGGTHEFDAVSEDGTIVVSIKSSSGLTATGRNPSGKIKDSIAELYFLSLVPAVERQLILTTPAFFDIFMKVMKNKIAPGISVRRIPLPVDIQLEVDKIVAGASAEVSPVVRIQAVAAEVEAKADES